MAQSSFQELMKLVRDNLASKDAEGLVALLETLMGLRQSFENDRDLLETVISLVKKELNNQ
jgi:hypothetical protein